MKLSMWMIANRLSDFEPELQIREKAPAVLNSARRVYATNCVYVYPEDGHVVCNGEGDIIRIFNMTVTQAFEIVQGVFDYYEDWLEQLKAAVSRKDYQEAVNLSYPIFRNPMVLFDGNNRVLGITKQYGPDSLDGEWEYISRYGYSSLNAVLQMRNDYSNISFSRPGSQFYQLSGNRLMRYAGISYCIYSEDMICGRMNLLEKERPLNEGDHQILEKISEILEPALGRMRLQDGKQNSNVFYNILLKKPYDSETLGIQLDYHQWSAEGTFHLAVVRVQQLPDREELKSNVDILLQTIQQNAQSCVILKKASDILILANFMLISDKYLMQFLKRMAENNPVKIGFSLPCRGLDKAGRLYSQAGAALSYGIRLEPEKSFYHFFDYAIDFIIGSCSPEESVHACMPGVVQLWEMQQKSGDDLYATLKCFLEHERSASRTGDALHTHRNTVLYRIEKIQDILKCSLDDPYVRDYCRLSMRTLELYGRE